MTAKCPGNDMSKWKPDDIQFVPCPSCGQEVEIWKDEPVRMCPGCGKPVRNMSLNLDCEQWCPAASECPGVQMKPPREDVPAPGDAEKQQ
jgi:hypothetical protein